MVSEVEHLIPLCKDEVLGTRIQIKTAVHGCCDGRARKYWEDEVQPRITQRGMPLLPTETKSWSQNAPVTPWTERCRASKMVQKTLGWYINTWGMNWLLELPKLSVLPSKIHDQSTAVI